MLHFDTATLLMQGQRPQQEDAVISCYPVGAEFGFTVLSDGMGGYAGGDLASKICIREIQQTILENTRDIRRFKQTVSSVLNAGLEKANTAIGAFAEKTPEFAGMGATVVSAVNFKDELYWASVGDSLLLLCRDKTIFRLNADHSLAPMIDEMVQQGKLSQAEADDHQDRSVLTSALTGKRINKIDCTDEPLTLHPGDILIVASDGLEYLSQEQIIKLVEHYTDEPSESIARRFKSAINVLAHAEQDNVSMSIVKVLQ